MRLKWLFLAGFAALMPLELRAGNSAWMSGKVRVTPEPDGSGWDAPHYSGVELLRANIPAEVATQLAGPDPIYTTMIYEPKTGPELFFDGCRGAVE